MLIMNSMADSQILSHHAAIFGEFNYSLMDLANTNVQNWQFTIRIDT